MSVRRPRRALVPVVGGGRPSHQLAVAGGALLANTVIAFAAQPVGDVSDAAKYAHNTIGLLAVLVLLANTNRRRPRDAEGSAAP